MAAATPQQTCVALIVVNCKYTSTNFPPLTGPENDANVLQHLLHQNDYKDVKVLKNIDNIQTSIKEFSQSFYPQNIDVIHFHYSGYGENNLNVDINKVRQDGNFETSIPHGECLVGCNGTLYSVKELKSDLVRIVHEGYEGKWTISLDMCRKQFSRSGSASPTINLKTEEPLPHDCLGRIAIFYGTYDLHVAMDIESFSNELCALVGNDGKKSFPILGIAKEVNKRWKDRNIKQRCILELVEEGNNWEIFRWPSSNYNSDTKPKVKMVLLGGTGAGKSTLANILAGKDPEDSLFPVSEKISSCTYKTTVKNVRWRGNGIDICLIDTPGLGDDSKKDSQNIFNIVTELKKEQHINTFVLVFNGQEPRFNASMRSLLIHFKEAFGAGFLQKTVILFSRWGYGQRDIRYREKKKLTEESRQEEFNQKFKEIGLIKEGSIPAVFIDSCFDSEFADEGEEQAINDQLDKLHSNLSKNPYSCEDLETVQTEEIKKENMERGTGRDKKNVESTMNVQCENFNQCETLTQNTTHQTTSHHTTNVSNTFFIQPNMYPGDIDGFTPRIGEEGLLFTPRITSAGSRSYDNLRALEGPTIEEVD